MMLRIKCGILCIHFVFGDPQDETESGDFLSEKLFFVVFFQSFQVLASFFYSPSSS